MYRNVFLCIIISLFTNNAQSVVIIKTYPKSHQDVSFEQSDAGGDDYKPHILIKELVEVSTDAPVNPILDSQWQAYKTVARAQQSIVEHRIIARMSYYYCNDDECYVMRLDTFSKEDRNKGYASLLFLDLEREMRQHKASKIKLYALSTAINFYKKRGFRQEADHSSIMIKSVG